MNDTEQMMASGNDIKQRISGVLRLDRALRLVWNAAPGLALLNLFLVVIQGALPLAVLYMMKQTVDAVSAGVVSPDKPAAFKEALFWIILTGIAALLIALFRSLSEWASEAQSQKVTDILHSQSIAVDLGYYEDPR
jgi:ATP-binding cassette subfamily B protein